jgi:aryl-alcohol dehydrogenase-like predicted oxidoreductase
MPKNLAIVDAIAEVAARHGVSNAQIALAWLLAQGEDIVAIPGVKRGETMRDSAGASDVMLTADDLAAIAAVAPAVTTAGLRYAEAGMARVKL